MVMTNKLRTCIVTTSSEQVDNFILPYIESLAKNEELLIISNSHSERYLPETYKKIQFKHIPFTRNPNLINDLSCLISLYKLLRKYKPSITYSINPKTGLITSIAAFLSFVPKRVHMVTGQVWATKKGFSRWILKQFDKIIAKACTNLIIDSQSQLDFLVDEKVASPKKSTILGEGSISGVDTEKFKMDKGIRILTRKRHGIQTDDTAILFLGRMTNDKGIFDLLEAFHLIIKKTNNKNLKLLFVGPDEGVEDRLNSLINQKALTKQIQVVGSTTKPQDYFNAADIFCLPSYREGFGQVVIEAACSAIPTVGSRIYGLTDAVVENETGLLHEAKNIEDLALKLSKLVENKEERKRLGENAFKRATTKFSEEAMVQAFNEFHEIVIKKY